MATNQPDVAALVAQMPEVDKPGSASKFTGPHPNAARKVYAEILGGGRPALMELLSLVKDPADPAFDNYKAEYVLHGLAIFAGQPGKEKERRLVAEALAARLDDAQIAKPTRGLFIRQLQVVGGPEVVEVLGQQLKDAELGPYAVAALQAIGTAGVEAIRKSLDSTTGRTRLGIIQALGRLGDKAAAADLRRLLDAGDSDTRSAAAWALGNMADADSTPALIKAADAAEGVERIYNTKACLLLAEKLAAANRQPQAKRIYEHLRDARKDEKEKYVREAAEAGLRKVNLVL